MCTTFPFSKCITVFGSLYSRKELNAEIWREKGPQNSAPNLVSDFKEWLESIWRNYPVGKDSLTQYKWADISPAAPFLTAREHCHTAPHLQLYNMD